MGPAPNGSLPLCHVLEQEHLALAGIKPDRAPGAVLVPSQTLEPMARRLLTGRDSVVIKLRGDLLQETTVELVAPYRAGDVL